MAARVAVVGASGWPGNDHVKSFHAPGARVVPRAQLDPRAQPLAEVVGAEVLEAPDQLTPWNHTQGLNSDDWDLEVDVVARGGRRHRSSWSLNAWDRAGSESVQHFSETDLFWSGAKSWSAFRRGNGGSSKLGERPSWPMASSPGTGRRSD